MMTIARLFPGLLLVMALMLGSCEPAYPAQVSEVVLQTIAMESADQPFDGQVAVASVIINRARKAGKTLEWVVLRPKQFSCWNDPKWAKAWQEVNYTPKVREIALSALNKAMLVVDSNRRLTHYHSI